MLQKGLEQDKSNISPDEEAAIQDALQQFNAAFPTSAIKSGTDFTFQKTKNGEFVLSMKVFFFFV